MKNSHDRDTLPSDDEERVQKKVSIRRVTYEDYDLPERKSSRRETQSKKSGEIEIVSTKPKRIVYQESDQRKMEDEIVN